eukprot:2714302-Pleurochrysis_carterae.AAC.1
MRGEGKILEGKSTCACKPANTSQAPIRQASQAQPTTKVTYPVASALYRDVPRCTAMYRALSLARLQVELAADLYTPVDATSIPTGEVRFVKGAMDLCAAACVPRKLLRQGIHPA